MTIKLKLLLIFLSLFLLIVMLGTVFYTQLQMLSEPLNKNIPHSIDEFITSTKKTDLIYRLLYRHVLVNRNLAYFFISHNITFLQNYYENIEIQDGLLNETKNMDPHLWADLDKYFKIIVPKQNLVVSFINKGNDADALKLLNQDEYVSSISAIINILNDYYQRYSVFSTETAFVNVKIAEKNANAILREGEINITIFILIVFVSIMLAFIGAYTISRPINLLRKNMERLSKNIDASIDPHLLTTKGEIGALTKSFLFLMEKLRSSEKFTLAAQESNRLKSEFLANVSHEFRTPLNGVRGFSELMMRNNNNLTAENKEYLENILSSLDHLTQLINNIFDIAEIESGKIDLQPKLVDILPLINEVKNQLEKNAQEKNITLTAEVDPRLKQAFIDPLRFKQVLYQYLCNALKFTDHNGKISVRAIEDGKENFILEVADTGIGISKENLPKLFKLFQQVDSSSSKKYQGTGLGLVLALRIVEAQGGNVWVESSLGKGSSFFARFPKQSKIDKPHFI